MKAVTKKIQKKDKTKSKKKKQSTIETPILTTLIDIEKENVFQKAQDIFNETLARYKKTMDSAVQDYQNALASAQKTMENLVSISQTETNPEKENISYEDIKIILEGDRAKKLVSALDAAIVGLDRLAKIIGPAKR